MPRRSGAIASYPEEFLACRAMGHAWRLVGLFKLNRSPNRVRVVACDRCEKRRRDVIGVDNTVSGRYYYQSPPGYALAAEDTPKGRGHRAAWVGEQFRRVEVVVLRDMDEVADYVR